jgi:hypothetical protein
MEEIQPTGQEEMVQGHAYTNPSGISFNEVSTGYFQIL